MDIIDLFKRREARLEEDTDNILDALTLILDGVCEFVGVKRDDMAIDRVMLIETEEIGFVVLITLNVPINPEDIPPEVRKKHKSQGGELRHLVSIGIPADMANATKDETVAYLKDSTERQKQGLPATEGLEIAQAMAEKNEETVH